jgi:tetratricopeptide (TPR) repeat protein
MTRVHVLLASCLANASMMLACAPVLLHDQEFVEIRTTHFQVMSSFDVEQTRELALALESYHSGTLRALGLDPTSEVVEITRVLAFDDRSLARPFSMRGADAYFVPTPDSGTIVLRTNANWSQRATTKLRDRYAHRLLRNLSRQRYPLWLEEGLAQYASTMDVRGRQIRIGMPIAEHAKLIGDWTRGSLEQILTATDLSEYTPASRADFNARSWALVHMLKARGPTSPGRIRPLDRYIQALKTGATGSRAREALGAGPDELSDEIRDYIKKKRFQVEFVQLDGPDSIELEVVPLPHGRALTELAELALALERLELAEEYFELALEAEPAKPRALAGLARARVDRFDPAEDLVRLALDNAVAPNAQTLLRFGEFYEEGARQEGLNVGERGRRLDLARQYYVQSLRLEQRGVAARLGLARTFLVDGEDAAAGIRWVETARELRPGSLEVELVFARLFASQGSTSAARRRAIDIASRSHSKSLRMSALGLLESTAKR